jgi:gentisate 1,2-dioxygenase
VYHVYAGAGSTTLRVPDGGVEVVTWGPGDTFAVPAWTERAHRADEGGPAYLFAVNDLPVIKALGMYRKE